MGWWIGSCYEVCRRSLAGGWDRSRAKAERIFSTDSRVEKSMKERCGQRQTMANLHICRLQDTGWCQMPLVVYGRACTGGINPPEVIVDCDCMIY
jgi:hypothetical protein